MSDGTLLHFLRKELPFQNLRRIVAALRMNPIIWHYLDNFDIQNIIQGINNRDNRFWFPANLALLQFTEEERTSILSEPINQWNERTQTELKRSIEYFDGNQCFPEDFRSITLLSIIFYRDIQDSGLILPTLLKIINPDQSEKTTAVLSIIFSLMIRPEELYKNLCCIDVYCDKEKIISNVLLTQPYLSENLRKWMNFIAEHLSDSEKIEFFNCIRQHPYSEDLNSLISEVISQKSDQKTIPGTGIFDIKNAQLIAELYSLIGDHENALHVLKEASQYSLNINNALAVQSKKLASTSNIDDRLKTDALEEARILSSAEMNRSIKSNPLLDNEFSHPVEINDLPWDLRIINAGKYIYNRDDLDNYLTSAMEGLLANLEEKSRIIFSEGVTAAALIDAIPENFKKSIVFEVVNRLLDYYPNDIRLLTKALDLAIESRNLDYAGELAELLILLEPDNVAPRQHLLSIFFNQKRYMEVLEEAKELKRITVLELNDELQFLEALFEIGFYQDMVEEGLEILPTAESNELLHTLLAKSFLALGKMNNAIDHFEIALEINSKNSTSWRFLAKALIATGEIQKSEACLRKGLLQDPEDEEMNYHLGSILIKKGNTTEGLQYVLKTSDYSDRDYSELLIIAECLIGAGYLDHAEFILNSISLTNQVHPEIKRLLLRIYDQRNDFKNLLRIYQELDEINELAPQEKWKYGEAFVLLFNNVIEDTWDISKAGILFETLRKDSSVHFEDAKLILSKIAYFAGKNEDSIRILSELITKEIEGNKDLSEAKTWLAHSSFAAGNIDLALVAYKEAVILDPQNMHAKIGLAKSFRAVELYEEAANIAESVLAENREQKSILFWYAEFQRLLGNSQKSMEIYNDLVRITQDDKYRVHYAELLLEQGEKKDCKRILMDLFNSEIPTKDYFTRASKIAEKLGELELAIKFITRIYDEKGLVESELNLYLVSLYFQKGLTSEAILHLEADLAQNSSHLSNKVLQAILFESSSEFVKAINLLEELNQGCDEFDSAYLNSIFPKLIPPVIEKEFLLTHLIDLYQATGDYEKSFKIAEAIALTQPDKIHFRTKAAELAFFKGDFNQAYRIANLPLFSTGNICTGQDDQSIVDPLVIGLAGLRAHLALEKDEIEVVNQILFQFSTHHECVDMELARIRLISLADGIEVAKMAFEQAHLENVKSIWLGSTLFDLERWDEALEANHSYRNQQNIQPPAANLISANIEQKIWQEYTFRKILGLSARIPSRQLVMKITAEEGRFSSALNQITEYFTSRSPEGCFTEALQMYNRNQFENCRQLCNRFPKFPKLVLLNSLATLEIDPDSAFQLAKQGIELLPQSGFSHRVLALIAERKEDHELALQAMEQATCLMTENGQWHRQIADWYQKAGDKVNEIIHLNKVYELDKNDNAAAFLLGKKYIEVNEIEKGISILENLESKNDSIVVFTELATAYLQLANSEVAIGYCEKVASSPSATENDLINCSRIASEANNIEKAFSYSKKAVIKNPENPQAIVLLARALAARDGANEGLRILEKAMEKGHQSILVRIEHALFVKKQRGIDSAKPLIAALLNEQADDPDLLSIMAVSKFSDRELTEAKELAIKAIRHNSKNSEVFVILGQIYHSEGQLDQAIENYSRAIELNPEDPDVYLLMVDVLKQRREFNRAVELLKKAIHRLPQNSDLLITAADLYKEGKNYQGAADLLQKASDLSPTDISIKRQLGAVLALNLVHFSQEAHSLL